MTKLVLYVDDDERLREYVARLVERAGYRCVVMGNAAQALTLLETGTAFDLIISDYQMPAMNGLDFLENVRSKPAVAATPFVLCSASDDPELSVRAATLGANFVPKSKLTALTEIIASSLPPRTQTSE